MKEYDGTEADAMEDWDGADEYTNEDGTFTANQEAMSLKRELTELLKNPRGDDKEPVRYPDGSIRAETVIARYDGRVITKERQTSLIELYSLAKSAKVGSVIKCPTCGTEHTKTTYHKVFCSNGKKTKKDCKTKYHNTIHPERLERVF